MIGSAATVAACGLVLCISLEAFSQGGLFAWHPICMSLGAVGFSTAGIQAVRSRWGVQGVGAKIRRVQVHSALSNLGSVSMMAGLYAIYTNKERIGKPHFTSRHAWVGLLAIALWIANVAIAAYNTSDLKHGRLVFLWRSRYHRWLGAAGYASGLAATCLGLHSAWGVKSLGGTEGVWALTAVVLVIFLGVISQGLGGKSPPTKTRTN